MEPGMIVFLVIIGLFLVAIIVGITISIVRSIKGDDYFDIDDTYHFGENSQISYNEYKGQNAERRVANTICEIMTSIEDSYLINNVILPSGNKRTLEFDHILLTKRGIFVFETKSIGGTIYGNENDERWVHYMGENNELEYWFYNPIKQNETQVRVFHRFLNRNDIPIYSCVVFDDGDISNIDSDRAITTYGLDKFIFDRIQDSDDVIDSVEVRKLFDKISYYKDHPIKSVEEHIEEVHQYH